MPSLESLVRFYQEVDARTAELSAAHASGLQCGPGCSSCCIDEISVFAVEAEYMHSNLADFLCNADPAPAGQCAFLDAGGRCRIYDFRPYVCRTQGLPLRWIEVSDKGNTEFRDICPVNNPHIKIMILEREACFLIGPFEQRLLEIQTEYDPVHPKQRIVLRSLFKKKQTH